MPVLAIGGEKSLGEVLGAQMKSVARNVTVIVLKNTGHWILEENTRGNNRRADEVPVNRERIDANRTKSMILNAFTIFHVVLSLIGIGSGVVVIYGLIKAKMLAGWTKLFLAGTATTSITGFFFPFNGFTPALALGVLSLIVLLIASLALYRHGLLGAWRRTYAITAVIAVYFKRLRACRSAVPQSPALNALAPTQSEPPFQIAQLATLVIFAAIGFRTA